MDGTMTEPLLDFDLIRSEMGIGDGEPILEAMEKLRGRRLTEARAVLHQHENHAAGAAVLSRGCRELMQWLHRKQIRTALITRNSRQCAKIVLRLHELSLDAVITRDDGPYKPDPKSVLLACRKLRVEPADVWLVGDGRYDVEAGVAAGVRTVWLSLGRKRKFVAEPWKSVRDLIAVKKLLLRCDGER